MDEPANPDSIEPSPPRGDLRRDLLITPIALLLVLAWDASGLDLAFALPFGTGQGFPLQDNWFMAKVMHEGMRRAAWIPALWMLAGIWWPTGVQRALSRAERVRWLATTVLALLLVSAVKQASLTSCPWDLVQFGGHAAWVSHWALGLSDGGPGRCFPAGHASAGFAFVSGYFALRGVRPHAARLWLAVALGAGLVLGLTQQLRGAHFMSHTLWTGWLCWTACWLCDLAARAWVIRRGRS